MQWTMSMMGMRQMANMHAVSDVLHFDRESHCFGGSCIMSDVGIISMPVAAGMILLLVVAAAVSLGILPMRSMQLAAAWKPRGPPGRDFFVETTVLRE